MFIHPPRKFTYGPSEFTDFFKAIDGSTKRQDMRRIRLKVNF